MSTTYTEPVAMITAQGKATLREYLAIPSDILAYEIRPFDAVGIKPPGGFYDRDWLDSFCEEAEARAFIAFFEKAPDCPYSSLEVVSP